MLFFDEQPDERVGTGKAREIHAIGIEVNFIRMLRACGDFV